MTREVEVERAELRASFTHAVVMLGATFAALFTRACWPLALAGTASLAVLFLRMRAFGAPGAWLPNAITFSRIAVTAWVAFMGKGLSGAPLAAMVAWIFALDGLDGFIARKTGTMSRQGAHLDMEADAFLVLIVCMQHHLQGMPSWVLLGGVLRYAYVVGISSLEAHGKEPRSRLARYAFGLSLGGYVAAFLPLGTPATLLAALSTLLLSWSFGRSFYWSFRATTRAIDATS